MYGQPKLMVTSQDFIDHDNAKERARRLEVNYDKFFKENPDWQPYADLVVRPPLAEELMQEFPDVNPEVLARCGEVVYEGGGFVSRGAVYWRVRWEPEDGKRAGDKWATMLCLNAPPGAQTTDSFWSGRKPWHQVFGDKYADNIRQQLAKRGVRLKPNDEYMPELARFQGDPEAVVPFEGARSYMKNLCVKRGWAAEGAINVDHREPEEDPYLNAVPLAEDLIRKKGRMMVKSDPSLKKLPRKELREKVLEKFGPSK